jgi:hypothetical protein
MRYQLPTLRQLLLHQFDSLVDYLAGETVDGDVYPVMLFVFDNEIVLQIASIWLEVAGLSDHVNQQVPHARLRRQSAVRYLADCVGSDA